MVLRPAVYCSQLMAALAPDKRLEFEAERLRLVQQLLSRAGSSATAGATAAATAATAAQSGRGTESNTRAYSRGRNSLEPAVAGVTAALSTEPNSSTEAGSTGSVASTGQRIPGVAPKLPDLVSGHYLLDFGCVTKGTSKSRKVKLTNMSSQQVTSSQHSCPPLQNGTLKPSEGWLVMPHQQLFVLAFFVLPCFTPLFRFIACTSSFKYCRHHPIADISCCTYLAAGCLCC